MQREQDLASMLLMHRQYDREKASQKSWFVSKVIVKSPIAVHQYKIAIDNAIMHGSINHS